MRRWGLALAVGVLMLGGCATDAPPIAENASVEISRRGGDMGIDDTLEVRPDGSWTYTDHTGKYHSATGQLPAGKVTAARAILERPGFAEEISVTAWSSRCVDPPTVTVRVDRRTSTFVSCGDSDQKNMNDLLQLLLEEVYNRTGT